MFKKENIQQMLQIYVLQERTSHFSFIPLGKLVLN
jgi:hypothetical protein